MKEIVFINKNIKKWQNFESLLSSKRVSADVLSDFFIQLTDDLAYAQTFYTDSEITKYLNSLTLKTHLLIYKNKKEKRGRIAKFWKVEFPQILYEYRKFMLFAFIFFALSILIGAFSASQDEDFIRLIMGDRYVNMTLQNIENDDPMAVYKNAKEIQMFLGITLNNILVSFWAFILGIFFSIGTIWILFSNGIMVGSFLFFMFEQNVLYESILSIFMHGTLELFAIVVAASAGLILGNSLLFPKTYSRLKSFRKAFKTALKIIIGLIPFFIIAGFIEGFITRYTQVPDFFRITFILFSVILIIAYFFVYPVIITNNTKPSSKL